MTPNAEFCTPATLAHQPSLYLMVMMKYDAVRSLAKIWKFKDVGQGGVGMEATEGIKRAKSVEAGDDVMSRLQGIYLIRTSGIPEHLYMLNT